MTNRVGQVETTKTQTYSNSKSITQIQSTPHHICPVSPISNPNALLKSYGTPTKDQVRQKLETILVTIRTWRRSSKSTFRRSIVKIRKFDPLQKMENYLLNLLTRFCLMRA